LLHRAHSKHRLQDKLCRASGFTQQFIGQSRKQKSGKNRVQSNVAGQCDGNSIIARRFSDEAIQKNAWIATDPSSLAMTNMGDAPPSTATLDCTPPDFYI
jgi:hypothetical protein